MQSRAVCQTIFGSLKAQAAAHGGAHRSALVAEGGKGSRRAGELAHQQARLQLLDALTVAAHLGHQHGQLEAKGYGHGMLAMGAPGHDGYAMGAGLGVRGRR